MRRSILGALAALTLPCLAPAARAETFVLDADTGAHYDAVGDGWFFAGPSQPPPDGVGDAGGQALAVGLITGALELRAMGELSLAPLAGLTASQVVSATVTLTIDDVIGTFGPGAVFDNSASTPIAAYHYVADGTVTTADFAPPGLSSLGTVAPGLVTDASLAVSGALSFTVDATQAVKDALTNGDTHFGMLFGTTDSPTATSLDNLSPPGVAGGTLPFLTVQTIALTPSQLPAAEQTCQAALAKGGQKLAGTALKGFSTCFGAILKDVAPDATLAEATTAKCATQLDPAQADSKVAKAAAKLEADVVKKCEGSSPGRPRHALRCGRHHVRGRRRLSGRRATSPPAGHGPPAVRQRVHARDRGRARRPPIPIYATDAHARRRPGHRRVARGNRRRATGRRPS